MKNPYSETEVVLFRIIVIDFVFLLCFPESSSLQIFGGIIGCSIHLNKILSSRIRIGFQITKLWFLLGLLWGFDLFVWPGFKTSLPGRRYFSYVLA